MARKKKKKSSPNNYSASPKIPKFNYATKDVEEVESITTTDSVDEQNNDVDLTSKANTEQNNEIQISFRESVFDSQEVDKIEIIEKKYEFMERKVVLVTFWEGHSRQHRNNDLLASLKENINNPVFDKLYVFEINPLPAEISSSKITKVNHSGKLRFSHIFKYIKDNWEENTIYVIANHNISFDYKISRVHYVQFKNKFVVLSRWNRPNCQFFTDWNENNTYTLQWDNWENHDVWIFQDDLKSELIEELEPRFVVNKSSAKVAHLLQKHGYICKNYSYDMPAYRNYPAEDVLTVKQKVFDYPEPYGTILPSHLKSEEE